MTDNSNKNKKVKQELLSTEDTMTDGCQKITTKITYLTLRFKGRADVSSSCCIGIFVGL